MTNYWHSGFNCFVFVPQFQLQLNHQNCFGSRASNGKYRNFHAVAQHLILEPVVHDQIQQLTQQQFTTPNPLNTVNKSTTASRLNFVNQLNLVNMCHYNSAAISDYQVQFSFGVFFLHTNLIE